MSTILKVYNGDEVTIAVGPVIIDSGYADGEFVRIEQDSDDTEDTAGTDGEVTVSRTNDRRGTITIMLMQTADANQGLSILSNLVKTSPKMAGAIVPSVVRDQNGLGLWSGENTWVRRPPDPSFDRTPTSREWQVRVAHLVRNDGGN